MNHRAFKPHPKRSCPGLLEKLRNTIDIPSSTGAGLPQDAPVRSTKRRLNEIDQPPAKKARLQQLGVGSEQHTLLWDQVDPVQVSNPKYRRILEWLESVGSAARNRRCRSESHLQPADDTDLPSLARSAPAMSHTRDLDGSTVSMLPWTDLDDGSNVTGSTKRTLVETPNYRRLNLAQNGIYVNHPCDPIPKRIFDFLNQMRQDRDSPGPSVEEVSQDRKLHDLWLGASEADVAKYFLARFFPDPESSDDLIRNEKQPMAKRHVPNPRDDLKVSTPIPDTLYGYNCESVFRKQLPQLPPMTMETEMLADNQGLAYPFLIIEFKGDAGSLWVATNQCLGGSATCVNMAERLNGQLKRCTSGTVRQINSAVFSIAMNNTEARLCVSWKKNEQDYLMATVDNFLLQDPEHYAKFYKYVHNILDWGRGERLDGIRKSLDSLLEERKKKASAAAKSRKPRSAAGD